MKKTCPKIIPYIIHESPLTMDETKVVGEYGNKIVAEGVLQDLDVVNRNRRVYAKSDMLPELKCERTRELIESGNFKGENGHPMSDNIARQQTIDPMLVCVKYLKIWNEGNLIMGQFTGTNNQLGEDFNKDLRDGEKPSFSLRALGSLETVNGRAYVRNLKIITWDRVIYPSHKRAYTQKIVSESADVVERNNEVVVQENYSGKLIPINDPRVVDFIKMESASLNMLSEMLEMPMDNMMFLEDGNVRLYNENGQTVIMSPEKYIKKEIFEYCSKQ